MIAASVARFYMETITCDRFRRLAEGGAPPQQ
jgi:hypothetical protein